jgi:hypothetical protein
VGANQLKKKIKKNNDTIGVFFLKKSLTFWTSNVKQN